VKVVDRDRQVESITCQDTL